MKGFAVAPSDTGPGFFSFQNVSLISQTLKSLRGYLTEEWLLSQKLFEPAMFYDERGKPVAREESVVPSACLANALVAMLEIPGPVET